MLRAGERNKEGGKRQKVGEETARRWSVMTLVVFPSSTAGWWWRRHERESERKSSLSPGNPAGKRTRTNALAPPVIALSYTYVHTHTEAQSHVQASVALSFGSMRLTLLNSIRLISYTSVVDGSSCGGEEKDVIRKVFLFPRHRARVYSFFSDVWHFETFAILNERFAFHGISLYRASSITLLRLRVWSASGL